MQTQIYWQPQTMLHELQGAVIDFVKEDEVHYQNHFLPSGRIIASWTDSDNYFQNKAIGELPQLEVGKKYRVKRFIDNSDKMHAYLSWRFYDEKGQLIDQHYQNGDEDTFVVPANYASYRLDLLSAGVGSFVFHEIQLAPAVDGVLIDGDHALTDHLSAYLEVPEKVVSKTLRVVLSEPAFRTMDYPIKDIQSSPQAVLFMATDLMHCQSYYDEKALDFISQSKRAVKAKNIEFVGYGPISSLTALLYRQAVKGSTAVIPTKEELELPAGYNRRSPGLATFLQSLPAKIEEERRSEDGLLTQPSLLANDAPVQALAAKGELLASLTYLDWPLDKKAEKKRKAEEHAAHVQAEKAEKLRAKQDKKQMAGQSTKELGSANIRAVQEKKAAEEDEKPVTTKKSLFRRGHGFRKHQLERAEEMKEKPTSSQLLQDFFTKNRS
ncbi:accessory Sec system protein Asp3 [Fructobacillus sp. CRL 2054]|uniref:accessory Sec system protein Asp3 n=1 Tax=Fructobacillus sp. CRL 2054 TaxID=2763007 RepID=UPI002379E90E|nr:accessory Sec system protein Asp3 [Fructobacillus sp. CRL 2054]MDD9138371.1 accessory Sec system protein Asp3 [Fructobacillus sp. CRL 2054]